jgi:putative transposase
VKRRQADKFEVIANGSQQRDARRFAGACRFVFNKALALQEQNYKDGGKFIRYEEMAKHLIAWKKDPQTGWLKQAPSQALQQALKNLETAYQRFFDKIADHPTFRRRGQHDSFRFPQGFTLDQANSRIFLPKLGWLRYRNSREVVGTPKNVTMRHSCGKWFISIQTERDVEPPVHEATTAVGIDLGVARFATLSDGQSIAPLNSLKQHQQHQQRLARYQRSMARKQKFSKNWVKAKAKVQKLHRTIANVRRDFLHKTSTAISKNHALVCIEDLKVANMSRSAKGSKEQPGRNVKAKSGLNRSILDQGWSEFRRQLEYKQAWLGGRVVAVPPQHTSQRCACCGHIDAANRLSQARFACVSCRYEANADFNAACNILAAGHAVLACGEPVQSGHSVKQEPAEATAQEFALV